MLLRSWKSKDHLWRKEKVKKMRFLAGWQKQEGERIHPLTSARSRWSHDCNQNGFALCSISTLNTGYTRCGKTDSISWKDLRKRDIYTESQTGLCREDQSWITITSTRSKRIWYMKGFQHPVRSRIFTYGYGTKIKRQLDELSRVTHASQATKSNGCWPARNTWSNTVISARNHTLPPPAFVSTIGFLLREVLRNRRAVEKRCVTSQRTCEVYHKTRRTGRSDPCIFKKYLAKYHKIDQSLEYTKTKDLKAKTTECDFKKTAPPVWSWNCRSGTISRSRVDHIASTL